jgi:hypothetical protein
MNVKLLVDAIVRQTTVLIAQLSTNAGVRAPLAHLADQVFLSLSREIEAQGVKRIIAADMFGLALRSYQKKTQRASSSATEQGRTLFEAILEYVETNRGCSRETLLHRFRNDNEREVIGVVYDLVQSGLLYATGSGASTLYGITTEAERQQFTRRSDVLGLASMALGLIYRSSSLSRDELAAQLNVRVSEVQEALDVLREEARVEERDGQFRAASFLIDENAEHGWEAAAFDHFQAVAKALANKVYLRSRSSDGAKLVSGTTLHFDLTSDHPMLPKVLRLLEQTRELCDAVWEEVFRYNELHPVKDEDRVSLTFYLGQNVDDPEALTVSKGAKQ